MNVVPCFIFKNQNISTFGEALLLKIGIRAVILSIHYSRVPDILLILLVSPE
jgi:hypothetical protein